MNPIEVALDICLAVCAQDGLVSDLEEKTLAAIFEHEFNLDKRKFDEFVDNFFASDESIESYLSKLNDDSLHLRIIEYSEKAASSDGLDIRENIAFQKVKLFLGADNE